MTDHRTLKPADFDDPYLTPEVAREAPADALRERWGRLTALRPSLQVELIFSPKPAFAAVLALLSPAQEQK
jgi:hypothetical protein